MLDHQHRVAQIAHAFQCADQAGIIPRMQADGGLIKHVQDAHQARADLGGQADSLGFAAGKGAGRAIKREVIKANIDQEA